jgi:hypothetical protein
VIAFVTLWQLFAFGELSSGPKFLERFGAVSHYSSVCFTTSGGLSSLASLSRLGKLAAKWPP